MNWLFDFSPFDNTPRFVSLTTFSYQLVTFTCFFKVYCYPNSVVLLRSTWSSKVIHIRPHILKLMQGKLRRCICKNKLNFKYFIKQFQLFQVSYNKSCLGFFFFFPWFLASYCVCFAVACVLLVVVFLPTVSWTSELQIGIPDFKIWQYGGSRWRVQYFPIYPCKIWSKNWYLLFYKTYDHQIWQVGTYTRFHSNDTNHSHKKRKDSLKTRAEPGVFSLKLEFRKLWEPSPRKPA